MQDRKIRPVFGMRTGLFIFSNEVELSFEKCP